MRYWLLFLLAVTMAACNLVAQPDDALPDGGGSTETYTNTVAGYAFDFPADWHLIADDPRFVQLWSLDPQSVQNEAGFEGVEGDYVIIGFLAEDELAPSLDALVQRYEEAITAGGATITASRPVELASGLQGVELQTSDGAFVVLTMVNGRGLHVDSFGSTDMFYSVVNTLRETTIEASSSPRL